MSEGFVAIGNVCNELDQILQWDDFGICRRRRLTRKNFPLRLILGILPAKFILI